MTYKGKEKRIISKILLALLPYTNQNILLIFRPNQFFDELERKSGYDKAKLRSTYSRMKREKVITITDNQIALSLKAKQIVQPFIAKKLMSSARLMVIFDIPEDHADRRRRFRYLLRHLGFIQIQQSVWMSDKDYREIIFESIVEIEITDWVQLYEASKINDKNS